MQKTRKFKAGLFLVILSTLLFISLLAVPFLETDAKTKITISTIAIVLGEITFWTGGILLGKELFDKYKSYLNPMKWVKKKTTRIKTDDSTNSTDYNELN